MKTNLVTIISLVLGFTTLVGCGGTFQEVRRGPRGAIYTRDVNQGVFSRNEEVFTDTESAYDKCLREKGPQVGSDWGGDKCFAQSNASAAGGSAVGVVGMGGMMPVGNMMTPAMQAAMPSMGTGMAPIMGMGNAGYIMGPPQQFAPQVQQPSAAPTSAS
jgi:hypothetical protein